MSPYLVVITLILAVALGFMGGMATYQKSRRWCTRCCMTLTCRICQPGMARHGRNSRS